MRRFAIGLALLVSCAARPEGATPAPVGVASAQVAFDAPVTSSEPSPAPPIDAPAPIAVVERPPPPDAAAIRRLSARLSALVAAARLGGRRSIVVTDFASGAVLHDDGGALELVPASNTKLFTTAVALDTLGDDHRLETRLVAHGAIDAQGTLEGDLALESGEDFTWSMRDEKHPGAIVDDLVERAFAAGLRRVSGRAVATGTFFVEGSRGAEYEAPAHRAKAQARLVAALRKRRIAVGGKPAPGSAETVVATLPSPPLLDAASVINRRSHNGFAEVLLLHLGARAESSPTAEAGERAIAAWLGKREITGAHLVDGSGLSRGNHASAGSIVRVLTLMAERHPTFASTLAVAGEAGTVASRMTGDDTRGRVLAKTGTLAEVTALAGYVDNRHDHRRYVFAIVLNEVRDITGGRRLEDRLVEAIAAPWALPEVKSPP